MAVAIITLRNSKTKIQIDNYTGVNLILNGTLYAFYDKDENIQCLVIQSELMYVEIKRTNDLLCGAGDASKYADQSALAPAT